MILDFTQFEWNISRRLSKVPVLVKSFCTRFLYPLLSLFIRKIGVIVPMGTLLIVTSHIIHGFKSIVQSCKCLCHHKRFLLFYVFLK
jgi:hypothetical protein